MSGSESHNREVVSQFTQQAEAYSRLTGSIPTDRSAALRGLVQAGPDDALLDLCCGPGALALDFAAHVRHVTGVDLTPAMLDQARAAQAQRGIANVEWREGDIYALPFADGAFSIVVCSAAFHHVEAPGAAFAEMARVCRPGGRIAIRDVTPAPEKSAAYDLVETLRDPSHVHALTVEELASLGEKLPVDGPVIRSHVTPDLSLDGILAASFPETCTIEDIAAMFREDALSGEDLLGFSARFGEDGRVLVSYPMTTAVWTKRG